MSPINPSTDSRRERAFTCASGLIGTLAKHQIRAEYHPNDPDAPGGWE